METEINYYHMHGAEKYEDAKEYVCLETYKGEKYRIFILMFNPDKINRTPNHIGELYFNYATDENSYSSGGESYSIYKNTNIEQLINHSRTFFHYLIDEELINKGNSSVPSYFKEPVYTR